MVFDVNAWPYTTQPTWGVKLRPLKDVPSLPQDDKVEERRSSLVRQSTLAALEQKEMQTRENSPHPLDSIALNQAPLKPIEPIGYVHNIIIGSNIAGTTENFITGFVVFNERTVL